MPRFVTQRWHSDPDAPGPRRNRESYLFRAFVPDPIAELDRPLPADLATAIASAERAVADLNRDPPVVASLEAVARRLLRAESVASSRIEGLELSQRRLAKAEAAGASSDDATARAIVGNIDAMERAIRLGASGAPVRRAELVELHRVLLRATSTPQHAGRLRAEQSWIGGTGFGPRGAEFVPPPHDAVPGLVDDLCAFLGRDDVPAVLQAAIAHAQFETIHPFADGNGRVGRALIHVVLRRRGLATRFVPPVSLLLAARSRGYVRGLTAFREDDLDGWCRFFCGVVEQAAERARTLAGQIAALQAGWQERAGVRSGSTAALLLERLPAYPVLTVSTVQQLTGRSKQAANQAVGSLERAGVLRRTTLARRNRAFEAAELFDLVNRFERRIATDVPGSEPRRRAPRNG